MDPGALARIAGSMSGHLELVHDADGVTPWRLPAAERRYAPEGLSLMAEFTPGVHLRLRTDADRIEVDASIVRLAMRHLGAPAAPARLVIQADGEEHVVEVDDTGVVTEAPDGRFVRGPAVRTAIGIELAPVDTLREVVVWLPHDAGITLHAVRATRGGSRATLEAARPSPRARWIHHGSSISHGGSATLPTGTWPVLAAGALDLDLVNLGFGGNAMLDPLTATAISRAPADVITLKIGVNIVGADVMRRRTFLPALHGFLDRIREGHPTTPLVVISAIGCPALETSPGPIRPGPDGRIAATPRSAAQGDGTLTLEVTRALVREVIAARALEDDRLFTLDGRMLLAPEEDAHLPDGLHPDDAGYVLMAGRFVSLARDSSSSLGRAFDSVLD